MGDRALHHGIRSVSRTIVPQSESANDLIRDSLKVKLGHRRVRRIYP
jgi:hypothetical protein